MPEPANHPSFFVKYTYVLYLIFCFYVGTCLAVLPWISWIWENNYFLFRYPGLKAVLLNSFFRGAISGLGVLNMLIGIEEIARKSRGKHDRTGKQ